MDALVSPFTQESGLLFEDLNGASQFPAAGAVNWLPLSNHDFLLPPVHVVRGKVVFILQNVCLSTGGAYLGWLGGTYLELGVPTLDGVTILYGGAR